MTTMSTARDDRRVSVYRNLRHGRHTTPLYSVLQNGRVIARVHFIVLRDVRFRVREAGRQRVIREHRKNVHAFVTGIPTALPLGSSRVGERVTYNPYEAATFVRNGEPIHAADYAIVNANGIEVL